MCYDVDARPPQPPVHNVVGAHGQVELCSGDGTRFAAYQAHPRVPTDAGVVVLPDVRGLHPFYCALAQAFAQAGLHAVAIDYFGRTAGVAVRGADFDHEEHVRRLSPPEVDADVAAAVGLLRGVPTVRSVFSVGFCLGGSYSWRQSAAGHDLAGCVGFYGRPERVADRVDAMRAPLLLMAAGLDRTPVDEVERFAQRVRGVAAQVRVYPQAPHSFFDRGATGYAAQCADAWSAMLEFVGRHAR